MTVIKNLAEEIAALSVAANRNNLADLDSYGNVFTAEDLATTLLQMIHAKACEIWERAAELLLRDGANNTA